LREPNSDSCPRSRRTRDSLARPERNATSLWLSFSTFRRAATDSPNSANVRMIVIFITLLSHSNNLATQISLFTPYLLPGTESEEDLICRLFEVTDIASRMPAENSQSFRPSGIHLAARSLEGPKRRIVEIRLRQDGQHEFVDVIPEAMCPSATGSPSAIEFSFPK
jgi:hypothetical protein